MGRYEFLHFRKTVTIVYREGRVTVFAVVVQSITEEL
jgi:hypothetical protein